MIDVVQEQTPELVRMAPPGRAPLERWRPHQGAETYRLLEYLTLPPESADRLVREALGILARCAAPTDRADVQTGLVVGNVQSGKTMSFTTVAALARDNGYHMVIVITGISTALFEQSTKRLLKDLQIHTPRPRKWKHFSNPGVRGPALATIGNTLDEWQDHTVPESEYQTVLITVMKNHRHLQHLNDLLARLDLSGLPTLVIDDEADQAGLNMRVNEHQESTTYRKLLDLKARLPHHSFLQYTATPQAPLLINIIDVLSPSFAELLTPGPDYVGGRDFFIDRQDLVRIILPAELPRRDNPLTEPPDTLLSAMRLFFLGVAAGIILDDQRGNRSMLIHPSQGTMSHEQYFRWVRAAKTEWQRVLTLPDDDPDKIDVIRDFEQAYSDLAQTVRGLPPFDALLARLAHALRRTQEEEVNARRGRTPPINWYDTYGHILVGGQAMDRGFTVEGLTVTYMPRGVGVRHADVVQQRGRFFGYKRQYIDYCRIFLEEETARAYRSYVAHEEDMRRQLAAHRARGEPLDNWKRAFLLAPNLKPTRENVLDLSYMRYNFGSEWYWPKAPHDSPEVNAANKRIVAEFIASLRDSKPDEGASNRTPAQVHLVCRGLPLEAVVERLLMQYRVTRPIESQRFTALRIQLQQYREQHPGAQCSVYVMSRGQDRTNVRERVLSVDGELKVLFQGANAPTGYPGDAKVGNPAEVRVQIHFLRLTQEGGAVVVDETPAIAVWLPARMTEDVVIQPQGRA